MNGIAEPGRLEIVGLAWRRHAVSVFCEEFGVQSEVPLSARSVARELLQLFQPERGPDFGGLEVPPQLVEDELIVVADTVKVLPVAPVAPARAEELDLRSAGPTVAAEGPCLGCPRRRASPCRRSRRT